MTTISIILYTLLLAGLIPVVVYLCFKLGTWGYLLSKRRFEQETQERKEP